MDQNPLEVAVVEDLRTQLHGETLKGRHRVRPEDFTRQRALSFSVVMLLLLQKTLKSTQAHLREFFAALHGGQWQFAVTGSAWTQARAKLRHTALIKLNQESILKLAYGRPGEMQRWQGHRLLALDGSVLRLPPHQALFQAFGGTQEGCNQYCRHKRLVPMARYSELPDCLNRLSVDVQVGRYEQGEQELAHQHLPALGAGDVLVADRGYASYLWLAALVAQGTDFVVRCSRQSFAEVGALFRRNEAGVSQQLTLHAKSRQGEARAAGLPLAIPVRLVTVRLSTGELEVLITTLRDEQQYPTAAFGGLYHRRWGVETHYGLLKGRLDLEHSSGQTEEAVRQDLHASVLVANLESILTRPAQAALTQATTPPPAPSVPSAPQAQARQHPAQVNRALSLHLLKSRVLDLLGSSVPAAQVVAELTELFQSNPVLVRPERSRPRVWAPARRVVDYLKRQRKIVF